MGKKPSKSKIESEFPVEIDLSEIDEPFQAPMRGRPTVKLPPVDLDRLTRACK